MRKKERKNNIIKAIIIIIFILIAIIDILLIKRIEKLETELNSTELKCLKYYEKTIEILK